MSWDYLRNREVTWWDRLDIAWGGVQWVAWICIGLLFFYGMSGAYPSKTGAWVVKQFDTPWHQQQRLKNRGNDNE